MTPEPRADTILEPDEADAIREAVGKHFNGEDREEVGPRTIRCLLFRYQLARDVLTKLGQPKPDPRNLADVVISFYAGSGDDNADASIIDRVVRQVSHRKAGVDISRELQ